MVPIIIVPRTPAWFMLPQARAFRSSGVQTRHQVTQDVLRQFLHSRITDRRVECCLNKEQCMEMFLHDEN